MKSTIGFSDFKRAFEQTRPDNFSREGLVVLFDYLEQVEADTGSEIEFDVIGLCCDYSEGSIEEIATDYAIDLTSCEDDDAKREAVREYLEDNTQIAGETADGFVYCSAF
jgi:hypothetical protein